jgi:hypothetical protein
VVPISLAIAQDFKPLRDVISSFKAEGDLVYASYLYRRCAGLHFALGRLEASVGASNAAVERLATAAANSMIMSSEIEMEIEKARKGALKSSAEQAINNSNRAAHAMAEVYLERMKKNYITSGEYFSNDTALEEEIEICKDPNSHLTR